ncbi:hypothetical protein K100096D8_06140 [Eggerthella lenta]
MGSASPIGDDSSRMGTASTRLTKNRRLRFTPCIIMPPEEDRRPLFAGSPIVCTSLP